MLASGGPDDYIVSYTIYVEFASLFYTAVFNFFLFCLFLLSDAEALHWIQENIQEFGGDPARVTLVGFGAGAACVHFLMTSPAVVNGNKCCFFLTFFFLENILCSKMQSRDIVYTRNKANIKLNYGK